MDDQVFKGEMVQMKKKMFIAGLITFNLIALAQVFTVPVQAYVDPSAVTYIFQAVAAVLIAIGAVLTIFRHKIAAFFKKDKTEERKREIHFTDEESADPEQKE